MKRLLILLLLLFLAQEGHTQNTPRYGCQFWQAIVTGIEKYKVDYKRKYDSIINRSSNRLWFDDSLFHFKKMNYVIDTFGFFGAGCNTPYDKDQFVFKSSFSDTANMEINIFILRSVHKDQNKITLVFRHPKSEWNIIFEFKYVHYRPILSLIGRVLDEVE